MSTTNPITQADFDARNAAAASGNYIAPGGKNNNKKPQSSAPKTQADYDAANAANSDTVPIPTAELPSQNPNIQQSVNNQVDTAKKYRDAIPQMSDELYGNYAATSKRALADSMKKVDQDFNRRGLLNSGLRQGAGYQTQAANSADLANTRVNINNSLLNNANALEGNAASTAAAQAGLGVNLGNSLTGAAQSGLNLQNANNAAQQGIYNSVGGAAGSLAGTIYGNYAGGGYNPTLSNQFVDNANNGVYGGYGGYASGALAGTMAGQYVPNNYGAYGATSFNQ